MNRAVIGGGAGAAGGAPAPGPGTGARKDVHSRGDFQESLDAALQGGAGPRPAATPPQPSRPAPRTGSGLAFAPGWELPPSGAGDAARLRWASQQLEALFLEQLWRGMRRTVMQAGMLDGPGVRLFEEMLDQERARIMAATGTLGLADMVYEQMSRHIPVARDGRTTPGGREDM